MSVTAISWGRWRAEIAGDGIARVRAHWKDRSQPKPPYSEHRLHEASERGLREVIWRLAREAGEPLSLSDADEQWVSSFVAEEFRET